MISGAMGSLRQAARWIRNRLVRGGLILLYHRVAEAPSDPQSLCVTPGHFVAHLEILRKSGYPIRLQQLVEALQDGRLPDRAVVVTFDDGYADNLHNAKVLLERHDIPATVFVTTGYLGHDREFWWDELEKLVLQPGTLPEMLRLNVNGTVRLWDLAEAINYSEDDLERHRGWNVSATEDPTPRQRIYRSLCQLLRPLPERERRKVLDELLASAGAPPTVRRTHRALSPEEVIRLGQGGLVEVGAHTVTHPVLSALPLAAQLAEIQESKGHLEAILGQPVMSFAYPYGGRSDYTAETVTAVREVGFVCTCSNFAGLVRRGTDQFQLPRSLVRNWDGDEFARRLV
jgi:peptidoglycan/xylan/chitin deacetylase (PgdA/CDA1 family)